MSYSNKATRINTISNNRKSPLQKQKQTQHINHMKCFFCNGNHTCRTCPIENKMAPILRKKVGNLMEYYIADNLECPECHVRKLKVIGNHTPSLDIICSNCNNKFEVKSKCLSVNNLPNDIKLPHGSYIDYVHRLNEGLNLIVIIYGVDRIKKMIKIREVLYANNNLLNKIDIIKVSKRIDNNLSTILIKNKEKLDKLKVQTKNTILTFKNDFDKMNKNI
jgi:hypothetical protein